MPAADNPGGRRALLGRRLMIVRCVCGVAAFADAAPAQVAVGPGLRVDAPATSLKELRDRNVVRQRFDYSCGAAALATLLRYGFGEDVTERDLLVALFNVLTEEEKTLRRSIGFSLLDLQRVARARGYLADGFRLAPAHLPMLGGPVIVYIEPRGYRHFAVLRGVRGDRVYLADPSRGNVRMPAYAFLQSWLQPDGSGIIFVVEPPAGPGAQPDVLSVGGTALPRPEMMSVEEMLAVAHARAPQPAR